MPAKKDQSPPDLRYLANREVAAHLRERFAQRERRGDKATEIVCVKITEAGRKAIAQPSLEVRYYH
jgi:hypothetical protein